MAKPVFGKTSTHTGVIRGRDVRERLMITTVDPKVKEILETLAEINHTNCTAIAEIATNQVEMLDLIQNFADIAGSMKQRTDDMARALNPEQEGNDDAPTNH